MPKFVVSYERELSTVGQEIKDTREAEIEFKQRPTESDFPAIGLLLENRYLAEHRGHLKKLLNISCKVKGVLR